MSAEILPKHQFRHWEAPMCVLRRKITISAIVGGVLVGGSAVLALPLALASPTGAFLGVLLVSVGIACAVAVALGVYVFLGERDYPPMRVESGHLLIPHHDVSIDLSRPYQSQSFASRDLTTTLHICKSAAGHETGRITGGAMHSWAALRLVQEGRVVWFHQSTLVAEAEMPGATLLQSAPSDGIVVHCGSVSALRALLDPPDAGRRAQQRPSRR